MKWHLETPTSPKQVAVTYCYLETTHVFTEVKKMFVVIGGIGLFMTQFLRMQGG